MERKNIVFNNHILIIHKKMYNTLSSSNQNIFKKSKLYNIMSVQWAVTHAIC